jgi:hypothetical protein
LAAIEVRLESQAMAKTVDSYTMLLEYHNSIIRYDAREGRYSEAIAKGWYDCDKTAVEAKLHSSLSHGVTVEVLSHSYLEL